MSSGRAHGWPRLARRRRRLAEAHAGEHGVDVDLGGGGLEGDVAGREPHVLVAGLLLPAGLVAAVGLEQAPAEVVDRRAADVLVEGRCRSPGWRRRMLAPKPSTVPMRVSVAISGSGTPALMRGGPARRWGSAPGQVSSGTSSSSVPNCSRVLLLPGLDGRARGSCVRGET